MVKPVIGLGWPQVLAGIGVAEAAMQLVPFGPMLLPWEDCRIGYQ